MEREAAIKRLVQEFGDLLNYEATDPTSAIDPILWRSPEGDSCLHIAAIRGSGRTVSLLIELGLDINETGDMGNTPLHYARQHGHGDIVDLLLDHDANPAVLNEFGERADGR